MRGGVREATVANPVQAWALFAVNEHGQGLVVDATKEFWDECDTSGNQMEDIFWSAHQAKLTPKSLGLHVWEGELDYLCEEVAMRGAWRAPTAAEIIAFSRGRKKRSGGSDG